MRRLIVLLAAVSIGGCGGLIPDAAGGPTIDVPGVGTARLAVPDPRPPGREGAGGWTASASPGGRGAYGGEREPWAVIVPSNGLPIGNTEKHWPD